MSQRRGLDADGLAVLEEERAYLLASLDDLDEEFAAGDMDDVDYEALKGDYTRRTAEVLRAIDEKREAFVSAPKGMSSGQRTLALLGVVVIAALAGTLLARSIGFRSVADSGTGGVAQSTAGLLAEAETLTFEREWEAAVVVYDELLENEPSNVEALTYRGWLQFQLAGGDAGDDSLADAVAQDPDYPDARVFRAIIFNASGRVDEAAAELGVLDSLDTPSEITGLLDAANLRSEVLSVQLRNRFGDSTAEIATTELAALTNDLDRVVDAARVIDGEGDAPLAIRLRDAVLEADPDNFGALVDQGQRLATSPDLIAALPEAAERGLVMLNRAVELKPDATEARVFRGLALALQGDLDTAAEDLVILDQRIADGGITNPEEIDFINAFRAGLDAQ